MNAKEKYQDVLNFSKGSHGLKWEFGFWGGTINRWHKEGLPKINGFNREVYYGETICGGGLHWPRFENGVDVGCLRDKDVELYFNFDHGEKAIPDNVWFYPAFKEELIDQNTNYRMIKDTNGIVVKMKNDCASIPQFLEWPVKDFDSWEKIKNERLNLKDLENRVPFGEIEKIFNNNKDSPVVLGDHGLGGPVGFFGSLRSLFGEVNLFLNYYDNPKLIHEINSYLTNFWIKIFEKTLTKFNFDAFKFWEDMAYKNGSMISEDLFREFMMPYYKKLINHLKNFGLKHFIVDSDGNCNKLIPLWIECGITGILPTEVQADMDVVKLRKNFPNLQIFGGIDKKALIKDKKSIDTELQKVEYILKLGGYVPYVDHLVPPDVSWENYKYYRNKLNNILG